MDFERTVKDNVKKNINGDFQRSLEDIHCPNEELIAQKNCFVKITEKAANSESGGMGTLKTGCKLKKQIPDEDSSTCDELSLKLNAVKSTLNSKHIEDFKMSDSVVPTLNKSNAFTVSGELKGNYHAICHRTPAFSKEMSRSETSVVERPQESTVKQEISGEKQTCEKQLTSFDQNAKNSQKFPGISEQRESPNLGSNAINVEKTFEKNNFDEKPRIETNENETQEEQKTKALANQEESEKTKIYEDCLPKQQIATPPSRKENELPRIFTTPNSEPQKMSPWLLPFEVDPMSQTFLRMPFTYQSLQVQCNQDNNRPHVKRPMNAFMVWAKKNRATIAKSYPKASNAEISVRLGHIWNQLPTEEQRPYFDEANNLKEKHKHENPNWVYQPRPGKKCRKTLFTPTGSQSLPSSPVLRRTTVEKHRERPIEPRSLPNSPVTKRALWIPENSKVPKIELSEDELQSNIVEELLEQEEDGHLGVIRDSETGNPTMDQYIDEWLSPKKPKRDANDVCLMNGDAMLSAVMNDDEQEVLEREAECDGRDVDKYIKQLKSRAGRSFTKFENTICSLDEDDDIGIEKISVVT